jgi:RNase P subunit RPR2
MAKKSNKEDTKQKINEFFCDLEEKNPGDVMKIKKLAMSQNIKLGDKKKKVCKKCLTVIVPGKNCEIKIKNNTKNVKCLECGFVNRWKLKI